MEGEGWRVWGGECGVEDVSGLCGNETLGMECEGELHLGDDGVDVVHDEGDDAREEGAIFTVSHQQLEDTQEPVHIEEEGGGRRGGRRRGSGK